MLGVTLRWTSIPTKVDQHPNQELERNTASSCPLAPETQVNIIVVVVVVVVVVDRCWPYLGAGLPLSWPEVVVVVVVVAVALLLEDSPLLKDPSPHVSMPCLWIVAPSNATDASLQHGRNTWGCQLKRHLFNASCQGKSDYPPRCKRMSVAVFLHPVH